MILIAFNISHTQNIKRDSGSEKTYSNFPQNFYFPNAPIWIKVLCKDCIVCQLNKPYPNQKQIKNGLVEGMNRSLQEYLRCIINGNDTRYTEWSADVKLFPLAYISQMTTTLGMSPYEMVFNKKPRKPIMFTANSHKVHKVIANRIKTQFVIIYFYTRMMKIIFITHKSLN